MRALPVVIVALLAMPFCTAGSYIQPTSTRFDFVFQDSVSPVVGTPPAGTPSAYDGIEDAYISSGASGAQAQQAMNFGRSGILRLMTCVPTNGCKYDLVRHDWRPWINKSNVAQFDTVWLRIPFIGAGSDTIASKDTICVAWENRNWPEGSGNKLGTGPYVALDSCGVTGLAINAQTKCGGADTAWTASQSSARVVGDTTRVGSALGLRMSVLGAGGYNLSAHKAMGGLTSDRAPFPSAFVVYDHGTRPTQGSPPSPAPDTISINITALANYALAESLALNLFIYARLDTVTAAGFPGTPDSTRSHFQWFSSDADSATIGTSGVGSFYVTSSRATMYALAHPRIEYIGRWKQMPVVMTAGR